MRGFIVPSKISTLITSLFLMTSSFAFAGEDLVAPNFDAKGSSRPKVCSISISNGEKGQNFKSGGGIGAISVEVGSLKCISATMSDVDWIEVGRLTGGGHLSFTVSPNKSEEPRLAIITLAGKNGAKIVNIAQEGYVANSKVADESTESEEDALLSNAEVVAEKQGEITPIIQKDGKIDATHKDWTKLTYTEKEEWDNLKDTRDAKLDALKAKQKSKGKSSEPKKVEAPLESGKGAFTSGIQLVKTPSPKPEANVKSVVEGDFSDRAVAPIKESDFKASKEEIKSTFKPVKDYYPADQKKEPQSVTAPNKPSKEWRFGVVGGSLDASAKAPKVK